jgi:hypothetical protein
MRFLIPEMPFEVPLNAGILTYTFNNQPTGAKEHWRVTQATDDYRILRVDLDGQDSSGDSYLYHVTMRNAGIIERINFKFWNQATRIVGNLIVEDNGVTLVRDINGERLETTLDKNLPIWFSASMGLSFVGQQQGNALFLNANEQFALQEVMVANEECGEEEVDVGGKVLVGKCRHLSWQNHHRTIYLSSDGYIIKMQRPDGLTAQVTRYVRYQ